MDLNKIPKENQDLVRKFGAGAMKNLKDKPDFYTFNKEIIHSHRDFDKFFTALKKGEKCAIVSGFNASGTIHIGHKPVFDTNLFFQKKYGLPVFIPISDDESYVAGKIETQEQGLKYAKRIAKELLAYGFDPHKTYFIIDQIYTNIYNLAFKLSRKVTLSEIKATYGYEMEKNPGLFFYPTVQSAHILFPQEKEIKNVLVPIGPDEDSHIRICRDIASRAGYKKPSILHIKFFPGLDGEKMSASKPQTAIFLSDDEKTIREKINKAHSGGAKTIEEHRKQGGNPEKDVALFYLKNLFLEDKEYGKIEKDYKSGKLLSGEIKKILADKVIDFVKDFQDKLKKVSDKDLNKAILKNKF